MKMMNIGHFIFSAHTW